MDDDDKASSSAPSPKGPKPQELLERALKAKSQVKQRLGELSREHREIEARVKSSGGPSKRLRDDYRGRDDGPPPERALKRRTTDAEGTEAGAAAPSALATEAEGAGEATNDTATKMEAE